MREFVALEVGDPGDPQGREGSPRPPAHLTLRFLGEVAEYREEPIAAALASAAAATATFDFTLEGVGAFPSRNSARVVWVGVTAGREEVVELSGRVSEALARIGFPPEPHEFVPHVTLFRVRSRVERRRARELLEGSVPAPGPRTVHVTELFLKESSLTPQGPVHRTRGNFPLRGGPASVG